MEHAEARVRAAKEESSDDFDKRLGNLQGKGFGKPTPKQALKQSQERAKRGESGEAAGCCQSWSPTRLSQQRGRSSMMHSACGTGVCKPLHCIWHLLCSSLQVHVTHADCIMLALPRCCESLIGEQRLLFLSLACS